MLEGCLDRVTAVVFSPDDQLIASTAYDHLYRLWGMKIENSVTANGSSKDLWCSVSTSERMEGHSALSH